ncbi:Nn.00g029340.m01.CDS01 [Neocucurbitaria sp. VM-36]
MANILKIVQAQLDKLGELAFEAATEDGELNFAQLKPHLRSRVGREPASFTFELFQQLPLGVIEHCFGQDLASQLVEGGHIEPEDQSAAPAASAQDKGKQPAQSQAEAEPGRQAEPTSVAQASQHEAALQAMEFRIAQLQSELHHARAELQARAQGHPGTPAASTPANKDPFLRDCVAGNWPVIAVELPKLRATRGGPKGQAHRTAMGFLLHPSDKLYYTHPFDLARASAPAPPCLYKYGSQRMHDPAIKFINKLDGFVSSGDINVKLLSNDKHQLWRQQGKLSPGLCYNWFLQANCEHGTRCTLRHIELTIRERADLAYWNPVLLWHLDQADKRRQATNAFTQWFPDVTSCLKHIEGYQAGGEEAQASPRSPPRAPKRQRTSRWGPELE